MINAIINYHRLGVNNKNIPFVQLGFAIKGDEEEPTKQCSTMPIFLLQNGESYTNSGAAAVIVSILEVVDVNTWEGLDGMAVQLELDEEGNITKIANILDEEKYVVLVQNKSEEKTEEVENDE